ncbi:MAG: radical SAM protein [Methanobacteriota archaeon]|nr:MAG: radical SAM protein [Euryarchaeota archaeon]
MSGNGVDLESVHLLLTYKCDGECDHCFVWSGPQAPGTMSTHHVAEAIEQASEIDTVNSVYFEGGEPFLFYPILLKGVELARQHGFEVGIVSNAYWAETSDDAELWLRPLADLGVSDLSLSSDDYHGEEESVRRVAAATTAAKRLGIDVGVLSVKRVESCEGGEGASDDAGEVFFRGRAAAKLADKAPPRQSSSLTSCPEEPPNIARVHVDAYGNVLFCQGISIGNLRKAPLKTIISSLSPEKHPLIGPLIRGGPAALSEELSVRAESGYADACHMCYDIRSKLRAEGRLRDVLLPDQAYGD